MEALGGIVLDVTLSFAYRLAIDKELHLGLIGIDEDLTGFALLAPTHRPGMSVDVKHRLACPITLEHVITLLGRAIALHDALLVDVRNRIQGTQRGAEILEGPECRSRQVGHPGLFLQMPVEETDDVALRPVAFLVTDLDVEARLGVSARMTVASPFGMQEMGEACDGSLLHLAIIGEASAVPTCPNRRRIDIDDVGTEVAATNDRLSLGIELMGVIVERSHQRTDTHRIDDCGEIARPVIFVAEAPKDDARMMTMLSDHVFEHPMSLLLIPFSPYSTTTPGNLFPHEDAKRVAEVEHEVALLVMAQSDEVGTHVLDLLHLLSDLLIGHSGTHSGMVLMAMCTLQEQTATIEEEGPMLAELITAEAEATLDDLLAKSDAKRIERWRIHIPQRRFPDADGLTDAAFIDRLSIGRHDAATDVPDI